MTNLLAAVAWHPARPRSLEAVAHLPPGGQARMLEWLVAHELWRRRAVRGEEVPELLLCWMGDDHEVDFVLSPQQFLEVKRGATSPVEYRWFPRSFPKAHLTVIGSSRFETDRVRGITTEDFLLEGG